MKTVILAVDGCKVVIAQGAGRYKAGRVVADYSSHKLNGRLLAYEYAEALDGTDAPFTGERIRIFCDLGKRPRCSY